jgi:hypothetical protein
METMKMVIYLVRGHIVRRGENDPIQCRLLGDNRTSIIGGLRSVLGPLSDIRRDTLVHPRSAPGGLREQAVGRFIEPPFQTARVI